MPASFCGLYGIRPTHGRLNLAGMLLARFVVRFVRMTTLEIVGWVFAAMQAALAVEETLSGLKLAGFAPH